MAIRVLHVVDAFGVGGGVENGIANLIAGMDAARYEHVLCAVFHVGPQTGRYPAERAQIISLQQRPARFRSQVLPLARLIRQVRPQIVHSRNWGAIEAVFAARLAGGCAAIHSEHGVEVNPAAEPGRRKWFRRFAFETAHRVFSVSRLLGDVLAGSSGFARRKLHVIHNGVDTARFRPDVDARRAFRAEAGIGESVFCIGAVGRLNGIKDYPTLLDALKIFSSTCSNWQLLIAGDGPDRASLEQACNASAELRGRVRFLGASHHVPELLNAMDVYTLPSICEGISNSLLEAMATGVACVATATGGNPEVVVDGQSGFLFPVGDAAALSKRLEMLLWSTEERARLGGAARRRIGEEFSLGSMVRQYEAMYTQFAGGRWAEAPMAAALAGGKAE